jgi:hypothetical protein
MISAGCGQVIRSGIIPEATPCHRNWRVVSGKGGSNGIAYLSVRHDSGECAAVFRPRPLSSLPSGTAPLLRLGRPVHRHDLREEELRLGGRRTVAAALPTCRQSCQVAPRVRIVVTLKIRSHVVRCARVFVFQPSLRRLFPGLVSGSGCLICFLATPPVTVGKHFASYRSQLCDPSTSTLRPIEINFASHRLPFTSSVSFGAIDCEPQPFDFTANFVNHRCALKKPNVFRVFIYPRTLW